MEEKCIGIDCSAQVCYNSFKQAETFYFQNRSVGYLFIYLSSYIYYKSNYNSFATESILSTKTIQHGSMCLGFVCFILAIVMSKILDTLEPLKKYFIINQNIL